MYGDLGLFSKDHEYELLPPEAEEPKWVHEFLSRGQAEAVLSNDMRSGAFLVRKKEPGTQWALSLVHEGIFVHYIIERDGAGVLSIDNKATPEPMYTLPQLIAFLQSAEHTSMFRRVIDQDLKYPVTHF